MKKNIALFLAIIMAFSLVGCANNAEKAATSDAAEALASQKIANSKIFLITMDQLEQYWNNIDAGCRDAVEEIGNVEYLWTAPDAKDDAKQIEMINNAVANGADAILLAANGAEACNDALKEASAAGVLIVYVDSPASFEPYVQTLTTDNEAAGKTAGETMIAKLGEKGITSGKIGVVGVNASVASCNSRDKGFRSAFEGTDFELLETQYTDSDVAKAKDCASAFIVDGCVGVFGVNEGTTVGIGNAIKEAANDAIVGIGFDNSDTVNGLIKGGYIAATMVQNPYVMGYEGIKVAVSALRGTTPAEKILDTGVSVVTAD